MTLDILFLHIAILVACWYMILEYPKLAVPPYQEPVNYEQDSGALTKAQLDQIKDTLKPTPLNPKAAWPFPSGDKP